MTRGSFYLTIMLVCLALIPQMAQSQSEMPPPQAAPRIPVQTVPLAPPGGVAAADRTPIYRLAPLSAPRSAPPAIPPRPAQKPMFTPQQSASIAQTQTMAQRSALSTTATFGHAVIDHAKRLQTVIDYMYVAMDRVSSDLTSRVTGIKAQIEKQQLQTQGLQTQGLADIPTKIYSPQPQPSPLTNQNAQAASVVKGRLTGPANVEGPLALRINDILVSIAGASRAEEAPHISSRMEKEFEAMVTGRMTRCDLYQRPVLHDQAVPAKCSTSLTDDIALALIGKGLAMVKHNDNIPQDLLMAYDQAERRANMKGLGIWGPSRPSISSSIPLAAAPVTASQSNIAQIAPPQSGSPRSDLAGQEAKSSNIILITFAGFAMLSLCIWVGMSNISNAHRDADHAARRREKALRHREAETLSASLRGELHAARQACERHQYIIDCLAAEPLDPQTMVEVPPQPTIATRVFDNCAERLDLLETHLAENLSELYSNFQRPGQQSNWKVPASTLAQIQQEAQTYDNWLIGRIDTAMQDLEDFASLPALAAPAQKQQEYHPQITDQQAEQSASINPTAAETEAPESSWQDTAYEQSEDVEQAETYDDSPAPYQDAEQDSYEEQQIQESYDPETYDPETYEPETYDQESASYETYDSQDEATDLETPQTHETYDEEAHHTYWDQHPPADTIAANSEADELYTQEQDVIETDDYAETEYADDQQYYYEEQDQQATGT